MQVVHERCCGLDVHKKVVAACVLTPGEGGAARKEQRAFGTMTEDLERLAAWLAERGVSHVAMESTGSYWTPVWNLLEDRFTLVLANARHVKHVPGRKTDVKDAEWLAELLRHGLIQGRRARVTPGRLHRPTGLPHIGSDPRGGGPLHVGRIRVGGAGRRRARGALAVLAGPAGPASWAARSGPNGAPATRIPIEAGRAGRLHEYVGAVPFAAASDGMR